MTDPAVLVTGASGFVGSRLVRALVERGERVKVLVRASSSLRQLEDLPRRQMEISVGDIQVEHSVYAALAGCDRMFHVASVFKMWDPDPAKIIEPAVQGTRATLEAARRRGLRKIVVTSSVAALGAEAEPQPMDEEHEQNLVDPESYILSKALAFDVARDAAEEGLPVVIVLPSGIFGPGDWKPTPSGQGILEYLRWHPAVSFPVTAGGINVVDVDDVVSGHLLAMDRGEIRERYILGGENVSFADMFGLLHEITGLARPGTALPRSIVTMAGTAMELGARLFGGEPKLTRRLARDYAFAYAWVTSQKAEDQLGYRHRPARKTLERSVRWFLEHGYVPASAARRVRLELRS